MPRFLRMAIWAFKIRRLYGRYSRARWREWRRSVLFPAAALDSLRKHLDLEHRPATDDIQRLHIRTGEGKVLRSSRRRNGAQIRTPRCEDLNFPGGRRIQPALSIDSETVSSADNSPVCHRQAFVLREVAAIGHRSVVLDIKGEYISGATVVDVENLFIGAERHPIRIHVVDYLDDLASARWKIVDGRRQRRVRPWGGIGEIDTAFLVGDEIVRANEWLAVEIIGKHRFTALRIHDSDADLTRSRRCTNQSTLGTPRQAIRTARKSRIHEDGLFPVFSILATRPKIVSQKTIVPSGKAIGPSVPCNVTPGSPCPATFAMTTSIFVPALMTPAISSAIVSVGGTSGMLAWPCPWLNAAEPKSDTAARIVGVHLMACALQCLGPSQLLLQRCGGFQF